MKRTIKVMICAALLVASIICLSVAIEAVQKDGWYKDNVGWYYIEGGVRQRNLFIEDSKGTCCVGADGYMVYNAWRIGTGASNEGLEYYINSQGYMVKNQWSKIDGTWFYFGGDGVLAKDKWIKDSKGWCYVDEDGLMVEDDIVEDSKGFCLVDANGRWVTSKGWHKTWGGEYWVYVDSNQRLKVNSWMNDSKGWCYLGSMGIMYTDDIIPDSKGLCYVDTNGRWITTSGWHRIFWDTSWIYINEKGYLKTGGWMNDSQGWCYLDNTGILKTNTFIKDSKGLCFVDENGRWLNTTGGWEVSVYDVNTGNTDRVNICIDDEGYVVIDDYRYHFDYDDYYFDENFEYLYVWFEEWYFDDRGYGTITDSGYDPVSMSELLDVIGVAD